MYEIIVAERHIKSRSVKMSNPVSLSGIRVMLGVYGRKQAICCAACHDNCCGWFPEEKCLYVKSQ